MKICVYCASSAKIDEVYFDATEKLANHFFQANIDVVFGGGASGLMGKLADTMIALGGNIKGIMPQFMNEIEWAHKQVVDFEFTQTMHERKAKFLVGIDGIVTLPGGTGTLEELLEALTLKRLGQFNKPIVILNTNGYFDPLLDMLKKCVAEKFMNEQHLKMFQVVSQPEEVVSAIKHPPLWKTESISIATDK